jgi:hypothetical protein
MTLDDDLITTVPEGAQQELGILVEPPTLGGGTRAALIRHCTIVGAGSPGSLGVSADSEAVGQSSVSVTIDSSIIRGFTTSLDAVAVGGTVPSATASATIGVDYSDFETKSAVAHNGSSTATATITPGPHDTGVDPDFAATSGALAFQLSAGSPMIDAGNPALGSEESSTDLPGDPRVVAGHAAGAAVSDIGAFEFQPASPTVVAAGPPTGIVGTPVTFTATGGAPAPGDSLALAWRFDDGGSANGATVSHAFGTAGPHEVTVTAIDLDGFTARAGVTVTIAAVPVGVIRDLRIRPSRLRTAGAAQRRHGAGAMVSYVDTEPGVTAFAILRLVIGTRVHHRCVAASTGRLSSTANRCTLLVQVGSFAHLDRAGANQFRFTGLVGRRKLRRGSYRLEATPHDGGEPGQSVSVGFRVVGR